MIDYIIEILESNNRLIVPELGAFIVKQRNPLIIVFNEFLQYDDNILVDIISKKENIDSNEAKERIEKFTKEVKTLLDQGEYYALDKLGDLVKNPSGKILLCEPNSVFEKSILYQDNEIPIEIEETIEEDVKQKEVSKEIEAESEPEKISEINLPEAEEAKLPDNKETTQEKQVVVEKPKPVMNETEQKAEKKPDPELEILKPYVASPESKINHQPSTAKTKSIVVWVIVIVIINAAIAGIFLRNHFNSFFHKKTTTIQPVATVDSVFTQEDSLATSLDSTIKEVIASELAKKEVSTVTQKTTGNRYYIVAGVFRNESNADNLIIELKKKGFNPEKFEKGELYGVSYETFTSKDEAEKALVKIKSETDAGAWLKTVNY